MVRYVIAKIVPEFFYRDIFIFTYLNWIFHAYQKIDYQCRKAYYCLSVRYHFVLGVKVVLLNTLILFEGLNLSLVSEHSN